MDISYWLLCYHNTCFKVVNTARYIPKFVTAVTCEKMPPNYNLKYVVQSIILYLNAVNWYDICLYNYFTISLGCTVCPKMYILQHLSLYCVYHAVCPTKNKIRHQKLHLMQRSNTPQLGEGEKLYHAIIARGGNDTLFCKLWRVPLFRVKCIIIAPTHASNRST